MYHMYRAFYNSFAGGLDTDKGSLESKPSMCPLSVYVSTHSLGIAFKPCFAPRTSPMGIDLEALSPPTMAFAAAACLKSLYLRMKYIAPGSVPSVGLAFPTLFFVFLVCLYVCLHACMFVCVLMCLAACPLFAAGFSNHVGVFGVSLCVL
jgi:hypothetical protein